MCLPLPILRPDLDSSQDSRKVTGSHENFQKKKYQKSTKLWRGNISALWIVTTMSIRTCTKGVVLRIDNRIWHPRETLE